MFDDKSQPYSTTSKEATKQVTATDLSGFDLFFGNFERATVHLPGFRFLSRANTGLRDVSISRYPGEEGFFWSTIESPPVDPSIINLRQALIKQLCENSRYTQGIHDDIGSRQELKNHLDMLFSIPESEYFKGDWKPRCNLEILMEERGVTATNLADKKLELEDEEEEYDFDSSESRYSHGRGPKKPSDIIDSLDSLETLEQRIKAAIKNISRFNDPNLKAISASLFASAEKLGEMTPARIMAVAKDQSQRADLLRQVADFNAQLAKFGMLCAFADLAQRDEYCLCTFDESEDDFYQEAWNMLREKNGHKGRIGVDDVAPQILGDSPSSQQHIVICGSNAAGKSFCGERDLSLRLVAQSFGLAPAQQANIHIADSFIRVDRTSPAASDVIINGVKQAPSDFAREVLVRKDAYPKIGKRCRWYSDEAWTTTSSYDGFLLNVAEAAYLTDKGVRLFTITHNTGALKYWSKKAGISIHSFQVDESDAENPKSTRKLIDGIGTSRSFEVALGLGIAPEFIELGRGYLKGEYTVDRPAERNIEVREHTADERELLKQHSKSLRSLVPQSDELVGEVDSNGRILIRWRSIVEGLCKDTYDSSPLPIGSSLWKDQYRFPFWAISNNKDHFPAHKKAFPFAESTGFPTGFICDFIKHGATNNPEELIERTKFFSELSKEGVLETLSANLDELHKALNRVENAGRFALDDYPQALLNAIDLSMNKLKEANYSSDNSEYVRALGLVRQSLKLIRHHCAIAEKDNIFDSWLDKLEKIEKLEIQKEACLLKQEEEAAERRPENVAPLIAEQTEIEKQIKSILTGDGHLMFQYLPRMLNQIKPLIKTKLQKKSLLDMESGALKNFHQATKDLLAPRYYKPWMQDLQTVVAVAAYINDDRRPAGDLIDTLLSIDSVHLNQYANYLRPILELFFSCEASGETIFSEFISANRNQSDRGERTEKAIKWATMDQVSSLRFIHELWQFEGLLTLAKAIRDGAKDNLFAPVEFHGGREILIKDGWNITKPPSKQVSYDRNFNTGQQVEFSVGANMSGKSFDMCGLTWSLQFAQATGWAPGSRAYLPIFDQIIHIGRVPERRDLNLSAFGTEVHYWKEVVLAIKSGNQIYLAADEPFSSAPPLYWNGFTFAVAASAAESGTVVTIATHCQEPAQHFVEANPGLACVTHHQTSFDPAGNIVFEYIKRPGFDDSGALKVARLLGLPQEILDIASEVNEVN